MNGSQFRPNSLKSVFLMLNLKEPTLFYLLSSITMQMWSFLLDLLMNYLHEKATLLKSLKTRFKLRTRSVWKA